MHYISLFLPILAMTSCDDSRKPPIQSALKVENARQTSAYWFPNMEAVPPIVPGLPDDFITGVVTNKYIEEGNPIIVWGRSDVIEKLNQGATGTLEFFTVTNSFRDPSRDIIMPADRQRFISMCAAGGFSKIECGSLKIDSWTIDWFSGITSIHYFTAWLSHPDGRMVTINLKANETGFPLWKNFIKSFERSEQDGRADGEKPPN
jgi:hypothetical protein